VEEDLGKLIPACFYGGKHRAEKHLKRSSNSHYVLCLLQDLYLLPLAYVGKKGNENWKSYRKATVEPLSSRHWPD